jgi:hypothetical protein
MDTQPTDEESKEGGPQQQPATGRVSVKDTLDLLKNVAELGPLSKAYEQMDFSKTRLFPKGFLRR